MNGQAKTPLLILAGGQGTRLRTLEPHRPKPMIVVGGKPFLHWLIAHYERLGHRDFILSTGYKAEVIEEHPWSKDFLDCSFRFSRELTPLGTGGAVKAIFAELKLSKAWVINGDTLLPQPLPSVKPGIEALYSVLEENKLFDATPNLHVKDEHITDEGPQGRYFDAGATFLTQKALDRYRGGVPCSLHQVLKSAMEAGQVGYAVMPGTCYDIGTPERFKRFEQYLSSPAHSEEI